MSFNSALGRKEEKKDAEILLPEEQIVSRNGAVVGSFTFETCAITVDDSGAFRAAFQDFGQKLPQLWVEASVLIRKSPKTLDFWAVGS